MNPKVDEWLKRLTVLANAPLADYRDFINNAITDITQSTLAYFATVNATETTLTMIGWSKAAMINCGMSTKPILYKVEETGLWGDAIRERKPVITNDYGKLVKPTKKGYPAGHVLVRRHMNLPIFENKRLVMVVGVGNKRDEYTLTDAHNLTEFMNEVWPSLKAKL